MNKYKKLNILMYRDLQLIFVIVAAPDLHIIKLKFKVLNNTTSGFKNNKNNMSGATNPFVKA
jgi:hypothetical protein